MIGNYFMIKTEILQKCILFGRRILNDTGPGRERLVIKRMATGLLYILVSSFVSHIQ